MTQPASGEATMGFEDCWFLTGPTAAGKTALAIELAAIFPIEVVAMDSMTLYRGMDIGTAKPTREQQQRVPHHLLDELDPEESASVDWYVKRAGTACAAIRAKGKQPLFVGGTPLYLKALLRGLFPGPAARPEVRTELEAWAAQRGPAALHAWLREIDPTAAARIAPNDLRRLVRAIEVYRATGVPISEMQTQFARPGHSAIRAVCILPPREELNRRIEERVDVMLAAGWVDEVRRLLERGPWSREASQAVGYWEIADYLAGGCEEKAMRERIVIRSRQIAKRQRTWFRHLDELTIMPIEAEESMGSVLARVIAFFASPPASIAAEAVPGRGRSHAGRAGDPSIEARMGHE